LSKQTISNSRKSRHIALRIGRLFAIVFVLFLVISCGSDGVPRGVIPPEKFKKVLWDMMRAESYMDGKDAWDSTYPKIVEQAALYNQILASHKTNAKEFKKSLHFYRENTDIYKPIIDSMAKMEMPAIKVSTLDSMDVQVNRQPTTGAKPNIDSLRRVKRANFIDSTAKRIIKKPPLNAIP